MPWKTNEAIETDGLSSLGLWPGSSIHHCHPWINLSLHWEFLLCCEFLLFIPAICYPWDPSFSYHAVILWRPYCVPSYTFFFFCFLVLCVSRKIRMSNVSIHHIVRLSPTCCNPPSLSSSVISFLVFLMSPPLHYSPQLWFLEGNSPSLCELCLSLLLIIDCIDHTSAKATHI